MLPIAGIVSGVHFKEGDLARGNDVTQELVHTIVDLDCHRLQLVLENRKEDLEATWLLYEKSNPVSKEALASLPVRIPGPQPPCA